MNEEEEEEKFSVLLFCEYVCTSSFYRYRRVLCATVYSRMFPSVIIISLFTSRLQKFSFEFDQARPSSKRLDSLSLKRSTILSSSREFGVSESTLLVMLGVFELFKTSRLLASSPSLPSLALLPHFSLLDYGAKEHYTGRELPFDPLTGETRLTMWDYRCFGSRCYMGH